MANNEVVKILRVETQGSERTVKSLKQEISSLKDALLNLEKGSQEYDDAVKQLKKNQEDLSTVMNAGKQDVEALEGSYNYLVKTMAELKKEWRATTNEVRRNELGQQIDGINTKLKDMDASIGNYQRNVGNYADSFSEAMKKQQESTELTRAKLESVGKIASGLANGYAAVQGAMALFGVENEKLAQTFVKLQAAIALAQGVSGLKDLVEGLGMAKVAFKSAVMGVKSFITSLRGVKAAIAGTGIGLLVVAIGMLVEYFMTMEEEVEDTTDALQKLRWEQEELNAYTERFFTEKERQAYAQYVEDVKNAKDNVELLVQAEEKLKKSLEDYEEARLKTNLEDKQEEVKNFQAGEDESDEEALARLANLKKEREKAAFELQKFYAERRKEEADEIIEANKKREEERKKELEDRKKHNDEVAKIIEEAKQTLLDEQEKELHILEQKYNKEKEMLKGRNADLLILQEAYEKEKAAIVNKYAEEEKEKQLELLQNAYNTSMQSIASNESFATEEVENTYDGKTTKNPIQATQFEIDKLNELRELRIKFHNERLEQIDELLSSELLSAEMRMELETEKTNLIRENALQEQKYINETAKLQKEKIKEEKELKRQQVSSSIDVTRNLLDSTSKLFKQNSNEYKGIASAVATIDALKSANAAYSSLAGIPVVGTALGAAAAAAALVAGYANVKAIWDTDESGSNSLSILGSSASVTPSFNASEAMPVDYTRNLMTDAEMDEINKPTKVYVLESDITETQNKVEVTESNATF